MTTTANRILSRRLLAPVLGTSPREGDVRLERTRREINDALASLYDTAKRMCRSEDSALPSGARVASVQGMGGLLVQMPSANESGDAVYVLSVLVAGQWRILVLELQTIDRGLLLELTGGGGASEAVSDLNLPLTPEEFLEVSGSALGIALMLAEPLAAGDSEEVRDTGFAGDDIRRMVAIVLLFIAAFVVLFGGFLG